MQRRFGSVLFLGLLVSLVACGGGGGRSPRLDSVVPASGGVDGGLLVTLAGPRVGSDTEDTVVTFAGYAATDLTSLGEDLLQCRTPAGPLGPCDVVLTRRFSGTTLEQAFTFYPAPTLASVRPHGGPPAGGGAITLAGTGFLDNAAGVTTVTIGGLEVGDAVVVDDQTITGTAPAQPGDGAYDVVVSNQNGTATIPGGYEVRPPPTLSQSAPHGGPLGGGRALTLTGTGFADFAPGPPDVKVGGVAAADVVVVDDRTITCEAPAQSATGLYDVVVVNLYGEATLAGGYETWPAPALDSVSPPKGPIAGGSALTLSGAGFSEHAPGTPTVLVGGVLATGVTVVSDTQVTCTAPAQSGAGTHAVELQNLYGSASKAAAFTCVPAPTISSVTASDGPVGGLDRVTIAGTDLDTGALSVAFGGTAATGVSVVSSTEVTCVTPEGSEGAVDVVVSTWGGTATASGAYTYTVFDPDDSLFGNQWHLENTAQYSLSSAGEDANVRPAWDLGYTGRGTRLAIVDDGLELLHQDLSANVVSGESWDYGGDDSDPTVNEHGTSVAGVAAAVGGNGLGVTGAAPEARLVGYAVLTAGAGDADIADALERDAADTSAYNNSWGMPAYWAGTLYGFSEAPTSFHDAVEVGITDGRGGLGSVYLKAAGNSGSPRASFDGTNGVRGMNVIGAVNSQGSASYYSQPGACILVCAPSNDQGGRPGITTTDRSGSAGYSSTNYTSSFGGTSSATPLVTGVVALVLQVRPDLRWWEVPVLLALSARRNDTSHSDWTQNGADLWVNHQYGFGVVDAGAAVDLARSWTPMEDLAAVTSSDTVGSTVPKGNTTGVTRTIAIASGSGLATVHRATVTVSINHPRASDLNVTLTSPSGTQSVLAKSIYVTGATASNSMSGIPMVSWRSLGESPEGNWTLKIADGQGTYDSTWASWTLVLEGEGTSSSTSSTSSSGGSNGSAGSLPAAPVTSAPGHVRWWNGSRWCEAVEDSSLVAEWTPAEAGTSAPGSRSPAVLGPLVAERGFTILRLRPGTSSESVLSERAASAGPPAARVYRDGAAGDGRLRVLTGRVLLRVGPGLSAGDLRRIETVHGLLHVGSLGLAGAVRVYRVGPAGPSPLDVARALLSEPGVASAEPEWWTERALW